MMLDYDPIKFKEAQDLGQLLKSQNGKRNQNMDEMQKMANMIWDDEQKIRGANDSVAITRSPSVANKLDGATRLLSTTAPKWSVPRETNRKEVDPKSSAIEKWVTRVFECASRITSEKIETDVARSFLTFGMSVIAVDRTSDIISQLEKRRKENEVDLWLEAAIVRATAVSKKAPYLFTVWDPRTCYPSFDKLGLQALYREVTTTVGAVQDEFGQVAGLSDSAARTDEVILCSYWDYVYRYTWLWTAGEPLVAEKHGLPFIPVVVQMGSSSRSLYTKPEDWVRPFFYNVWRSNQWANENLYLTLMATATGAIGANAMYSAFLQNPEQDLNIDYSTLGGVAKFKIGESFGPTPKMVIDQSVMIGLERAAQDIEQSTIFGQTLGQPLGQNATYSMTALLHQAGRLPLAIPQEMSGRALAAAGKIALEWCKLTGKTSAGYDGYNVELTPADIPDNLELDCKLDIALPQDRLGNVNVARMATDPNNPLTSVAWAQTNVLGIEQPDEMAKEIMAENVARAFFAQYMQQMMQQAQQMQAQAPQPPPGAQPGQQPPMPPGGAGPVPPEMMAQMQAGGMQGPMPAPGEQQQMPPEMMGGPNAPNNA